ncbi:MAG: flagellar basal-body rod protein FlgG [Opitutae bacterium]|jgi:flagellar basal-body rod protein FlgG|nr:flagellar basal-body rod protein FlgG [Opitutae bacterium]MBT5380569.1 flagellar basal-body rod protein FlgG [Opitutae bacterium]MBT7852918.1 flagellar basal-body rod protein FlgG [Opitutae bacterium]
MNLSLYSGATGMEAQQLSLNTISNNIANVNTTGFKKSKIEFQDLLYQNPQPVGGETGAGNIVPVGIEMGNGTKVTSTARVYSQGSLTQTERELDFAIDGNGFFEIERADGTSGYSRDGALKVGPNGEITTSDGLPVLNGPNNLPPDRVGVFVSPSGLVSVQLADGTIQESGQFQLTRFSNPSGLKSIGGNLQIETAASGPPEAGNPNENGFGSIQQGYLEMSNVNVVEEMVNMIVAQRAYEINAKSIQTSDEMMGRVNQLKR